MTRTLNSSNTCPVCKTNSLVPSQLEPQLASHRCERCGGQWIRGEVYRQWLEHPDRAATAPPTEAAGEVHDSPRAMICPDCGRLLVRYRVGHGITFHINHCGGCGGIWLDANEWESLRQRDLSTRIHMIFSAAWQGRILRDQQKASRDALLQQRIGPDDFLRLTELARWVESHPHGSEIAAYLLECLRDTDSPARRG